MTLWEPTGKRAEDILTLFKEYLSPSRHGHPKSIETLLCPSRLFPKPRTFRVPTAE